MGNTWASSSQNVPVKTTLMWTCEDHGFQSVEDCITLHQEAKWSLTHRIIFQKRKNGQRIKARGFIQRSTRADRWGCEGQRSLIGEDYITPMGRGSGGGGGQQIQPVSLTNTCIVHGLRRQNSLFEQDGVLSIQWDCFDSVFFCGKAFVWIWPSTLIRCCTSNDLPITWDDFSQVFSKSLEGKIS